MSKCLDAVEGGRARSRVRDLVRCAMTYRAWLLVLCACGDVTARPADVDSGAAPDATAAQCPQKISCPDVPAGLAEGGGLVEIDRCGFPLAIDDAQARSFDEIITSYPLTKNTISGVLENLNRVATTDAPNTLPGNAAGVQRVFEWQSGDMAVAYWTPQGLTGSFDATEKGVFAGKKVVLVSWYYTKDNDPGSAAEKGVRVAIVDATDPENVRYRFALLVSPVIVNGKPDFAPVTVHAGGLAWVIDRLYVPDTTGGLRVFDLSRILALDGLSDTLGLDAGGKYNAYSYAYAIPEIARYVADRTCAPRFSFLSYDRDASTLVSGEYDADSIHGRLYRWPLDARGNPVREGARVLPSAAYAMGESHIQGGLGHGARVWLSSSRPAGGAGELDRLGVGVPTTRLGWTDSPEDLAYDPQDGAVWSLSEAAGARYVFEVALTAAQ